MAKHKIASISLTVRDKAISSKFSTHGVSKKCTLGNFQKIFPSSHMAAILNFRIFSRNGKTQIGRVATGQGKVREIQGQGKVREFCSGSGNFGILKKVREI